MTLPAPHRDWKLDQLPVPEVRAIGSDELLTQLWLRVAHDNKQTASNEPADGSIARLANVLETSEAFEGFEVGSSVAEAWVRADLVKVLKRKPDRYAVARPVHLLATRLRNTKRESDANASAIPYLWLQTHGVEVSEMLKDWLDVADPTIDELGDLPAYALAVLGESFNSDVRATRERPLVGPMLCPNSGITYVEDLRALLAYRHSFTRGVLVDHVRRLTRVHIGLHLLHTYRAVVTIAADPGATCGCGPTTPSCRWAPQVIADCGDDARSPAAVLAERSWSGFESELSAYVRAHLRLRKLLEYAGSTRERAQRFQPSAIGDLAAVARLGAATKGMPLDEWSRARSDQVIASATDLGDLRADYELLDRPPFDVYMSLLYADGERRWFKYHRDVLDSLFGKNERDGAMRQPLGGRRHRRMVLTPALLETMVLAAMVEHGPAGRPTTRSLRIDQLVDRLQSRYGLLVARPTHDDFEDPFATRAMIENHLTFRSRLRQAGLFVDQSDAFITQTIRPRVQLR
jgi:hypothetical protein